MSTLKFAVNSADHHRGNVNATITLVEYGDFQCPYCRRAHGLVDLLLTEKGQELHFVFRNFPLREIHPLAFSAAAAAEAAGKQDKFWEMYDRLYENQPKITSRFLLSLAEEIGLDLQQFDGDSMSEEIRLKIESDFNGGIRSGVNGTPTFFLNGVRVSSYDETYDSLLNVFLAESELQRQ